MVATCRCSSFSAPPWRTVHCAIHSWLLKPCNLSIRQSCPCTGTAPTYTRRTAQTLHLAHANLSSLPPRSSRAQTGQLWVGSWSHTLAPVLYMFPLDLAVAPTTLAPHLIQWQAIMQQQAATHLRRSLCSQTEPPSASPLACTLAYAACPIKSCGASTKPIWLASVSPPPPCPRVSLPTATNCSFAPTPLPLAPPAAVAAALVCLLHVLPSPLLTCARSHAVAAPPPPGPLTAAAHKCIPPRPSTCHLRFDLPAHIMQHALCRTPCSYLILCSLRPCHLSPLQGLVLLLARHLF